VEKAVGEKRRSGRESCVLVMCKFMNTGETIFQPSRVRRENFPGSAPKAMAISEETHRQQILFIRWRGSEMMTEQSERVSSGFSMGTCWVQLSSNSVLSELNIELPSEAKPQTEQPKS
jgi:hypothetical protein